MASSRRLQGVALGVASALLSASALAQDADDDVLLEYSLSELSDLRVQTASRSIEPLDRTSATVYVVTENDIRTYGYRNLADILENIPGLQTSSLGFFVQGGQRGLPGNFAQTLLLVNGREFSALATQEALIGDQFGIDNIRQVEVMNSPGSALYGANAYSGVINILTRDAAPSFNGQRLHYEYGSQSTHGASLISAMQNDSARLSVYFRQYRSDNWDFSGFTRDREHFSAGFPLPAQDAAAQAGKDYLNANDARSWAARLEVRGFYIGTDGYDIDSGKGLETVALDYDSQRDHRETGLWYGGWKGNVWDGTLTAEYQLLRDKLWGLNYEFRYDTWQSLVDAGRNPDAPLTQDEIYNAFQYIYSQENSPGSERHRGFVQYQKTLGRDAEITVGAVNEYNDLRGEALTQDDISPDFNDSVDDNNPMHRPLYRSHKNSAYLQWRDSYFSRHIDVTLGARFDDQSRYGMERNYRGGLVYHTYGGTHWRINYGEAFREPNIFELGNFNPPGSPASASLDPAKIRTLEVGVVHNLSATTRLQITAFKNRARGAILPTATATFANANLDIKGVETEYDWRAGRWRVDAVHTWMHTDERRIGTEDIDTLNVYPNRISLGVSYLPARDWRVGLRANYFSSMDADSGNPQQDEVITIPSATRLDGNVRYTATFMNTNDLEVGIGLHNMLDRTWYQPNVRNTGPRQFLQPGRQLLISLTLLY
jgi:outer membrane cobalamin receptor